MEKLIMSKILKLTSLISCLFLFSCSAEKNMENEISYDDVISSALKNPARAENNSSRDEARKPGDVIKFMEVMPGMTVLDMVSNGGFYAEILASVVGGQGKIIAHTFAANESKPDYEYAQYIKDSEHMKNVELIYANFGDIELSENTIDRVFIVQNYHDMYFDRPGYGVDDVQPVLAMIRKGLKPGGIMAIIDHEAEKGAPSSTGTTLHRISSDVVKADMKKAGFELAGSLDILSNNEDDMSKGVFDPSVRGKTNRFVLKFVSPD